MLPVSRGLVRGKSTGGLQALVELANRNQVHQLWTLKAAYTTFHLQADDTRAEDLKACQDRRPLGRSSPRNQDRCQIPPPSEHSVPGPTRRVGRLRKTAKMFWKVVVTMTEIYGQGSLEVLKMLSRLENDLEVVG